MIEMPWRGINAGRIAGKECKRRGNTGAKSRRKLLRKRIERGG